MKINDLVGITNSKSVAHFGEIKKCRIVEIKKFDGSPEIGGQPERYPNGLLKKAYILLFLDGTGYKAPYRREEITPWEDFHVTSN